MAGRSVGEIEVTVSVNTGRLTAQLTREGERGGKFFKKAAEEEMKDLQAVIDLQTSRTVNEAKLLRKQVEAQLKGIDLDLDIRQAQARIQELDQQAAAIDLAMEATVTERSIAEVNARLREMEENARSVPIELRPETDKINAELARMEAEARSVPIELRPETSRINAELAKLETEHYEATVQFQADMAAINANLAKLEAERHAVEVEFTATLKTALADAQAEALIARWENEQIEVEFQAQLRTALAEASADNFVRRISEKDAEIDLALETARASAEYAVWFREKEGNDVEIPVAVKIAEATAAFDAWLGRQMSKGIDVETDPDTVRATIEFDAWIKRMSAKSIDVDVDIDDASLAAAQAKAGAGGSSAGKSFGDGFGRGLSTRTQLIIGAVIALAEPVGVALQGSLAAATSVISSAFSGLAGGAGAALPVVTALGASVTTLIVGFQGLGDGLGAISTEFAKAAEEGRTFDANVAEIQEKLAGLSPSARDFAEAFGEMFPLFHELQQIVQDELFQGMGDALRGLTGQLPALAGGLGTIAQSFNRLFQGLAERAAALDLGQIFGDLQPIIDDLVDAGLSLFDTLAPFLAAAAPAAQMLSESLRLGAAGLQSMVEAGAASGGLTKFLVEGVESLRVWAGLLKDTGDALATLFKAGKSSGDGFVSSLDRVVNRWDDWMESVEGQEALANFFASGKQVMSDLKPVLQGLQGFFENLVTPGAVRRFGDLADSIGDVLPVLGQLLNLVGRSDLLNAMVEGLDEIGEALQPVMPLLQDLADTIGHQLLTAVANVRPVLDALAGIIGELAPVVEQVAEDLEGPLSRAFDTIADALADLNPHLVDMVGALGGALVQAVDAAGPVLLAFGTALGVVADAVGFLADTFSGLPGPIQTALEFLGGFLLLRSQFGGFASGLKGAFDTVRTSISLLGTSAGLTKLAISDIFTGFKTADATKISKGFKDLGPALASAAKGVGSVAGVAIAGGLAVAFGAQMLLEADNMAQKISGAMTIATSALGAFVAGGGGITGGVMAGVTLMTGAIVSMFQRAASEARKAKAEIKEYADAFEAMADGASEAVVVGEVMSNLRDETDKTKDVLDDLGFSVGDWALGMIHHTTSVSDGIEELASHYGQAGKDIAAAIDSQEISVDNLLTALGNGQLMIGDFDLRPFRQEINDAGLDAKDLADVFGFLRDEGNELAAGSELQAQMARLAGDGLKEEAAGAGAVAGSLPGATAAQEDASGASQEMADKMQLVIDKMIEARNEAENHGWGLVEAGIVGAIDPIDEQAKAWERLKTAAEEAETAVKDFDETMSILVDPSRKAQKATSDYQKALDDLRDSVVGGSEAIDKRKEAQDKLNDALEEEKEEKPDTAKIQRLRDEAKWILAVVDNMQLESRAVDLRTEAGREAGEVGDKLVQSILDQADAMITGGHNAAEAAVAMVGWRQDAIDAGVAAGGTAEQVAALIDQYGLTPEAIFTSFTKTTAGLDEASKFALQLDEDMNGIPDSIDTIINMEGITEAQKQILLYDADMDGIEDVVDTEVNLEAANAKKEQDAVIAKQAEIDALLAKPEVQLELAQFNADTAYVADVMGTINTAPEISLDQVAADIGFVGNLMTDLDNEKAEPVVDVDIDTVAGDIGFVGNLMKGLEKKPTEPEVEIDIDQVASDIGFVGNLMTDLDKAEAEPTVTSPTADQAAADIGVVSNVVTDLDGKDATVGVSVLNNFIVALQLAGIQSQLDTLNETAASPDITVSGVGEALTKVTNLDKALDTLSDGTAKVTIQNLQPSIDKVKELSNLITNLKSKTITVTVNQTGTVGAPGVGGLMAGGMVNGPRLVNVGERGYREAVVPMQLPLNRVDPSVRHLAEMIRGGGTVTQMPGGKTVNNYMTITPNSADPSTVATQIINRAAVLARS